jgi:hypothetical protein
MIYGNFFLLATQIRGGKKTQVKNYSAELLFFFHFWVFEVRRFRNPTNKISMTLWCNGVICVSFLMFILLTTTTLTLPLGFNSLNITPCEAN